MRVFLLEGVFMTKLYQEIIGEELPKIIMGCMRLAKCTKEEAEKIIQTAIDNGVTFFDHADIYGGGESERIFGKAIKSLGVNRDLLWIQSKAGIRKGFFDFSKEHLLTAVDGILERLETDYLDSFLVHRPDTLVDLKEFAETLNILHASGKVRYFGVSNCNQAQIEMLKRYLKVPLVFNQLQFGPMHTGLIDQGFNVNMTNTKGIDRDGSTLEYMRLNDMTLQAWSPLMVGYFEDNFMDNPKYPQLNECLESISKQYNISKGGVVASWILSHPASIQMITGTMTPSRLIEIVEGSRVKLSRESWYEIYRSAGNILP